MFNKNTFTRLLTVMLVAVFCACRPATKVYINQKLYNRISSICPDSNNSPIVLYYFDGDCSICIAKARYIETTLIKSKNAMKPIFIARTINPEVLKFNIRNAQIKSCVFIDNGNSFEHDFTLLQILKIDQDRSFVNYERELLGNHQ